MSLKKKNRLLPVMINEIVAGQTYLYMVVCLDGTMFLSNKVFYGRPEKHRLFRNDPSVWKIRNKKRRPDYSNHLDRLSNFDFTCSLGMSKDGHYGDNYHRVFRYTMRNKKLLRDLAERQAFVEYLDIIEVKDIAKALARKAQGAETMREMNARDNDWEHFDDDLGEETAPDMTRDLDSDWVRAENF